MSKKRNQEITQMLEAGRVPSWLSSVVAQSEISQAETTLREAFLSVPAERQSEIAALLLREAVQ